MAKKEYIMKKRRMISTVALLLCMTLLLSGSAMAAVLGSNIDGYSVQLTRGVTLKKNVYWTGSDYRAENYVELASGAAVYPKAVSRDILAHAMRTLSHCFICGHVHDELIIECSREVSLEAVCEQMGRTPPWLPGIELRADGYECGFYQKK